MAGLVQEVEGGKAVLATNYIGFWSDRGGGSRWCKIVQYCLFTERELQAGEGVALLHFGIVALLGNEPIFSQIAHCAESIGQPAYLQSIANGKVARVDVFHIEKFRLAPAFACKFFAKLLPIAPLGIAREHIERA